MAFSSHVLPWALVAKVTNLLFHKLTTFKQGQSFFHWHQTMSKKYDVFIKKQHIGSYSIVSLTKFGQLSLGLQGQTL